MGRALQELDSTVDIVFSSDVSEVIRIAHECFTFSYHHDNDAREARNIGDESSCVKVSVLAGVLIGNSVAESVLQQVVQTCGDGSYAVELCCCKPSDAMQHLAGRT